MKRTRYCRYCELVPAIVPPLLTVDQPDQLASGTAMLPVRTSRIRLVPGGVIAVQLIVPQLTACPALRTAEVKVPPSWRTQSTCMLVELVRYDDMPILNGMPAGTAAAIVVCSTPSTKNWNAPGIG